ncbi:LLM class F420-dependent oxidoreductase [Novosphingobium sp. PS1R-30]|uniref:LLM class F420-dependent oxidoreductase n=1 Tax=Novosphingobium anseongense TaxID=3133436 RepID=A0ABU8S2A1_9SPHN
MKLGLDIGYSGARLDLPMEAILRAEALGFDSIWTAESYGSDVFSPLAFIAARTSRIRLCSGIAQLAARTPANCAMVAQTIDALAGQGRVAVGLGVSGPQIVEGWYGQPWGKPSARLRDYVEIMRRIWRREGPVSYAGSEISLPYTGPGAAGLGKPLKSILHGNPDIPIYLGTSTPGNIRLTGEIADGWLSMHLTPDSLGAKLKLLEEGLARRGDGRTIEAMEIAGNVRVIVTEDVRAALDSAKATIALYVGGMGAQQKNFHKDAMVERGYGEAAERIQELFLAGRKEEALTAVPDEYVDEGALIGKEPRIAERFKTWRDAGFTVLRIGNPDAASMEAIARIANG